MTKFDRIGVPQWTQLGKRRGIDPLGMQNSSVRIYQRLLPGISNVTLRVRYYGLYVWLADRYAKDVGKTDTMEWQRRIRRAEALYALISHVDGGERGVAGAEWAARRLAEAGERKLDFSDDTEPGSDTHYLQNPWGVFGQAYQSQLFNIRLLAEVPGHEIAAPSPGVGDEIAQAFAASAGEAGTLFLHTLDRGWTTRKDLESMSPLAPSSIGNGEERDCYHALLMAPAAAPGSADDQRRKTLELILHWTEASARRPGADDLRWSMYSGRLGDGDRWKLPDRLETHRLRWAVYQANEIAHIALETLLEYFLGLLKTYPMGRPLGPFIAEAVSNVRACLDVDATTWGAFVEGYALPANASGDDPDSEWTLTRHARMTARQHGMSNDHQCAAAIRSLAAVQKRMARHKDEVAAELSELDPHGFRSLHTELEFLDQNANSRFDELLERLFLDRVVRRHLWVATRKLRYQGDYTFLIDTDDGLIRHRGTDGPVWTGPRLGNAITFLEDIGLLGDKGVTARGRRVVEAA